MTQITQIDVPFLSQLGSEAIALFAKRDFQGVADRFGYALSFDRHPTLAIEADFDAALSEGQPPSLEKASSITVKYFKANSTHLAAVVECVMPDASGVPVLIDLIVAGTESPWHISVEDISAIWPA